MGFKLIITVLVKAFLEPTLTSVSVSIEFVSTLLETIHPIIETATEKNQKHGKANSPDQRTQSQPPRYA